MHVQNALSITTNDRSSQIQAKLAAEASRRSLNLSQTEVRADLASLKGQGGSDPHSAQLHQGWISLAKSSRAELSVTMEDAPHPAAPSGRISLWA